MTLTKINPSMLALGGDLLFAETFADAAGISINSGLAGDFSKLVVRGNLSTSSAGSASLLTSNDGGATLKSSDYIQQSFGIWGLSPGSNLIASQSVGAIVLGANMIPGKVWNFEVELHFPNDGHPTWEKVATVFSAGSANPSDPFYYSRSDRYIFLHDMINALWLGPPTGTITGHVEVWGERRVDVYPRPANLYKIAGFGPSTTISGGWLESAGTLLQAANPSKRILTRNFGRNSMVSPQGLMNIGNVIASQPDAVVLDFALPDGFTFGTNGPAFTAANRAIVNQLRERIPGVEIFLLTSNPFYGSAAVTYPDLPLAYQMYRDLAAEMGVHIVDTYPLWPATDPGGTLTLNGDGVHPTVAANDTYLTPTLVAALDAEII